MAATSLLARLGLRIATLGSAASLAIAAPLVEGSVSPAAHNDVNLRVGVYFDRTTPADPFMGIVAGGVESLRVSKTKVDAFTKLVTVASAAVAGAGFNITPGIAPNSPNNGDVWLAGSSAFIHVGGVTKILGGDAQYVASVATEAQLAAAVAAAEASPYTSAVINITADMALSFNGVPGMTKNYTWRGVAGAVTALRPTLTKANGQWTGFSGNMTLINLIFNFSASTGSLFSQDGNNSLTCVGCSFTGGSAGGAFFHTDYAGSLTAEFRDCTMLMNAGAQPFLWFEVQNPGDPNNPQSTLLFTGCNLTGFMAKVSNGGQVSVTLVSSPLTDGGSGCWSAAEASAGRTSLTVNYDSTVEFSAALVAGSTDTITFTNRSYLPSNHIAYGVNNGYGHSAALTFDGSIFKVSPAVAGDGTIMLEAGGGAATTARAILFLRGNIGGSATGWFLIRNGTTVGSHLDLVYTPSSNINDGANKHVIRYFTDGGMQLGRTIGASPGSGVIKAIGADFLTSTSSGSFSSPCVRISNQATATATSNQIYGVQIDASDDTDNATTIIGAISGIAYHTASPSSGVKIVDGMYGVSGGITCILGGGTQNSIVTYGYGVKSSVIVGTPAAVVPDCTVGFAYGFHASAQISRDGAGAVTVNNYYGIYLEAPSISGGATITNRWGVCSADALATNYFVGLVKIADAQYVYLRGDATTNGSVRYSSQAAGTMTIESRTGGFWNVIGTFA